LLVSTLCRQLNLLRCATVRKELHGRDQADNDTFLGASGCSQQRFWNYSVPRNPHNV